MPWHRQRPASEGPADDSAFSQSTNDSDFVHRLLKIVAIVDKTNA
jgi:hypothetical protein